MKSDVTTRAGRLAYASKIGGMLARRHSKLLGVVVTLDRTYWSGNGYTWVFNINENGYCHKQLVSSTTILKMFNDTVIPSTPIHFMLIKLDMNRSTGV